MIKKSVLFGMLGGLGLLGFYFVILTLVSGWSFTLEQFDDNWYYVIALSAGFGVQIGLYTYLRQAHHKNSSGKVVAASGTTSTVAMIACCSHYLVNVLPIIGITGFVTIVSQYQTQLFWVGIAANLLGIGYMVRKVLGLSKNQKKI
ncbi:MAG: hypothetical protein Q8P80_00175 [Candidatus Levybacteria bacterium]|nr:hypothetical protein [Candidatus Levybacteria bacterium]